VDPSNSPLAWSTGELTEAFQKLFVIRDAEMAPRYGLQVHGVYGLSKEYPIERFFRDAKTYELLEGSSEVQRELAMDAIR
jgi:alkylation response protein AidB-like acyl-CoA dehydrogenase